MLQLSLVYQNAAWSEDFPRDLDGLNTLVLAFAAPEFVLAPQPLADLALAFPNSVLAGCSTAGEINGMGVHDASISVAVIRFEHSRLVRASTAIGPLADSLFAGQALAAQLPHEGLRAVFVLSDGLNVNGTSLVEGLRNALPADIVITGGLAGDGSRFQRTWVLGPDGAVRDGQVCAVGFYGERLRVGHGCAGGWSDFGPERAITRSYGNVLYELDGKPVLALYKSYLGQLASALPGSALLFPLSVRRSQADAEPLVRTILAINEDEQSLTFAGDIPQGGIARLMRANTDKLIDSAGIAAQCAALELGQDAPALVISVSCVGRRLVLGERTDEEVETVVDNIPHNVTHVGFYSYGEISPSAPGCASNLHNQTMTVTVLSEV